MIRDKYLAFNFEFVLLKTLLAILLLSSISKDINAKDSEIPHVSILGTYGGIMTPSARFASDRYAFLGIGYIPFEQRIVTSNWEDVGENHISANVMLTSYLNFTMTMIQPRNDGGFSFGIGDRSIKARFWIWKEQKYFPSIALGIHDFLGSNNFQAALYLVGSKKIKINSKINIDLNLGYGYNVQNSNLLTRTLFIENTIRNKTHLKGVFGSTNLQYKYHHILLEYDTEKINAGYSISLLNQWESSWRILAGIYTLGFESLSGQIVIFYRFGERVAKW